MLAALATLCGGSAGPGDSFVDIFVHGEAGFPCWRVPVVVLAPSTGILFAFAEARNYSGDQCYPDTPAGRACFRHSSAPSCVGPRSLALKLSRDGGRSWGPVRIVDWNGANPAAVYDSKSDRVIVHYPTPGQDSGRASGHRGIGGTNTKQMICEASGQCDPPTSLDPWLVWPGGWPLGLKPGTPLHISAGPGLGTQLTRGPHTGRLVFAGHIQPAGRQAVLVWFSDDGARTWSLSNTSFSNTRSQGLGCGTAEGCFSEPTVVQLPDGTLQLNARNESKSCNSTDCCAFGCGFLATPCCHSSQGCAHSPHTHPRTVADSTDAGATFGRAYQQADLPEPVSGCAASTITIGQVVLFSGPAGPTEMRTNMSIRRSDDGGRTYPRSLQIWAGPGGYSTLTRLPAAGTPGSCSQMLRDSCPAAVRSSTGILQCDSCAAHHQGALKASGCTAQEVQEWCTSPGGMSTDQVGLAFERDSGGWAGGCWGAACRISFAHVPLAL